MSEPRDHDEVNKSKQLLFIGISNPSAYKYYPLFFSTSYIGSPSVSRQSVSVVSTNYQ